MCGIAGVFIFNQEAKSKLDLISEAIKKLHLRGPDCSAVIKKETYALAHARLAIIDTSEAANQPFTDESGRYTMVFNGEIFNFKSIKKSLQLKGFTFKTESDTEVLLKLYMDEGHQCLSKLNGFFSFAIVDNTTHELFIARDRYGIKPLLYSLQDNFFCFASEMKALLQFQFPKKLNNVAMMQYFHLNYIAGNHSILEGIQKIPTGHYAILKGNELTISRYYQIESSESIASVDHNFQESCKQLYSLLDDAVRLRMIADVPLGAFLSGGIDSSIVTSLASKYTNNLNTFSIGFRDEPLFDETKYANMVAKKCGTKHTVFSLSNNDLFEHLNDVLSYIDEPFADSSALNVYILSKRTREVVTVALSGDGADEMFAGYNKHAAAYAVMNNQYGVKQMRYFSTLFKALPQSRNTSIGNKIRQINKLTHGASLSEEERYWRWAGFYNQLELYQLFKHNLITESEKKQYNAEKSSMMSEFKNSGRTEIEKVLLTDMKMVLAGDMLTKVDSMSMANSLEVRVPFLDYRVVDFAFNLPDHFKINSKNRKIILKEAFKNELPNEIFNRSKKGFEVPLLKWFKTDLKSLIVDDLLSEKWIKEQGLFNYDYVRFLINSMFSNNPGDAVARIWALIVFQNWYKKYYIN